MMSVTIRENTIMSKLSTKVLIQGVKFVEGLRWNQGLLWFCDMPDKKVYTLDDNQKLICHVELNDSPAAMGWLSDDRMVLTSLFDRKVLAINDSDITEYADLSSVAPGFGHDMIVAPNQTIYISTSGFYPEHNAKPVLSNIVMIEPSGRLSIAASQVGYPNGLALINNSRRMVVAETFAANIAIYDINDDGALTNKQSFYSFDNKGFQVSFDQQGVPEDLSRYYPDGIDYDAKRQILWAACPGKNQVVGIREHQILFKIDTQGTPFDCAVGGDNFDTLFVGAANQSEDGWSGQIEVLELNTLTNE